MRRTDEEINKEKKSIENVILNQKKDFCAYEITASITGRKDMKEFYRVHWNTGKIINELLHKNKIEIVKEDTENCLSRKKVIYRVISK